MAALAADLGVGPTIVRPRHLLLATTLLGGAGCDTFFTLEAVITACDTRLPLAGVKVLLRLDRGIEEPDVHLQTGPTGAVLITLNEPDDAWATLTLERDGYRAWSQQFRGAPKERPLAVCLETVPAPAAQ